MISLSPRCSRSVLVCLVAILGACSSVPVPTDQLARSRSAIEQAAAAGATEGAPAELAAARDKLARAEEAAKSNGNVLARRLAEESEADARLAISEAQVARQRKAVVQMDESNRALRQEMNRAGESTLDGGTP